MPDDATAIAILPSARFFAKIVLYKNVLPVPLYILYIYNIFYTKFFINFVSFS